MARLCSGDFDRCFVAAVSSGTPNFLLARALSFQVNNSSQPNIRHSDFFIVSQVLLAANMFYSAGSGDAMTDAKVP